METSEFKKFQQSTAGRECELAKKILGLFDGNDPSDHKHRQSCPLCKAADSFYFRQENATFHCEQCNFDGELMPLVQKVRSVGLREAYDIIVTAVGGLVADAVASDTDNAAAVSAQPVNEPELNENAVPLDSQDGTHPVTLTKTIAMTNSPSKSSSSSASSSNPESQTDTAAATPASNDAPKQQSLPLLEFHDYAKVFPELGEAELAALCADIEKNGLNDPITLYEGKILDGRNRYKCCLRLGIVPKTVEYTGNDLLAFVLSKNLHRRHLTTSQRAMIADNLANMTHGGVRQSEDESKAQICALPSEPAISRATAAKMLNVSERLIDSAAQVRQKCSPEVIEQVESGKKTINAALPKRTVAKQSTDQQSAAKPSPTGKKKQPEPAANKPSDDAQPKEVPAGNSETELHIADYAFGELKAALKLPMKSRDRTDVLVEVICEIVEGGFICDDERHNFVQSMLEELYRWDLSAFPEESYGNI